MINTLQYTKKLEAAGISRDQAEAHIQIIADIVEDDLVTKRDIRELEFRIVIKLSAVMASMFTIALAVIAILINSH